MRVLALALTLLSPYSDWLTPQGDITGDGINNLKDWNAVQSRLSVLRSEPTPEQVETLVLEVWGNDNLLDALSEYGSFKQYGNRVEILYEWGSGWFLVHWDYTPVSYEFKYWYGKKLNKI